MMSWKYGHVPGTFGLRTSYFPAVHVNLLRIAVSREMGLVGFLPCAVVKSKITSATIGNIINKNTKTNI